MSKSNFVEKLEDDGSKSDKLNYAIEKLQISVNLLRQLNGHISEENKDTLPIEVQKKKKFSLEETLSDSPSFLHKISDEISELVHLIESKLF